MKTIRFSKQERQLLDLLRAANGAPVPFAAIKQALWPGRDVPTNYVYAALRALAYRLDTQGDGMQPIERVGRYGVRWNAAQAVPFQDQRDVDRAAQGGRA